MLSEDLGFDAEDLLQWFAREYLDGYTLVSVDEQAKEVWANRLAVTLRRCYARDELIVSRAEETGLPIPEVIAAFLPEPGSIKAGDFGEVFVYLCQVAETHPVVLVGPKKWRMKAVFDAAAPKADVVQFLLPAWPNASDEDVVICAEVKTKSMDTNWDPITSAIDGCRTDRTSRLASTLVWLRKRAVTDDLSGVDLETLDRFLNADAYPPAERRFRAVALLEEELLESELQNLPDEPSDEYELVIVAFPGLYDAYNETFRVAANSLAEPDGETAQ